MMRMCWRLSFALAIGLGCAKGDLVASQLGDDRELEYIVGRAVVLTTRPAIDVDLVLEPFQQDGEIPSVDARPVQIDGHLLHEVLEDYERRIITDTVEQAGRR